MEHLVNSKENKSSVNPSDCFEGFTEFYVDDIANTGQKSLTRKNVYNAVFVNDSPLPIEVMLRGSTSFVVPAGKERVFRGHPKFPSDFDINVVFDPTAKAGHFLTVITSCSHGNVKK